MARIILLNGPPVNTLYKKNLHAFKNLASDRGARSVIDPLKPRIVWLIGFNLGL